MIRVMGNFANSVSGDETLAQDHFTGPAQAGS
jgi:hypothetical protein